MEADEIMLIKEAKNGSSIAQEALFRFHVKRAVRLAYLITQDWAAAEDTVQDAFVNAFRSLSTFQDGRPFTPWFTRIVVNQARKTKRRTKTNLSLAEIENMAGIDPSPEQSILNSEDERLIMDAVYTLDEKHRLPILLKYFSDFSEAEIAEILKIPQSTVKSRLYTARQKLKETISGFERSV